MSTRNARNDHLLALRSLSSVRPVHTVERSVTAIEALGASESSRILDMLRARALATRRLVPFAPANPQVRACLEALSDRVRRLEHMHGVLEENLDRLDQSARKAGIELFAGKGVGAREGYADPSVRDFNDIDIFVRSRADATRLSQVLRADHRYAYQHNELPWFKFDPADGLLYGQIALVAPDDAPDLVNVDIHFGDYSVRHCSRLSITETFPSNGQGLHRMAPRRTSPASSTTRRATTSSRRRTPTICWWPSGNRAST